MTTSPDYEAAKARLLSKSDDELLIIQTAEQALAQHVVDVATIATQAAEIVALKAAAGNEDEPDEPPAGGEADSPEGYSVAPGGQTITLGGHRYRIEADGTGVVDGVSQADWAHDMVELFELDGVLWQKIVAGWAPNGYFFHFVKGDAGQPNDPRVPVVIVPPVVVDPGTLPPVTGGLILPAGFRNFDGMTITHAGADDYSGDLITSNWNPGDFAYDYRDDGPFIKDGVLGMRIFGLDDPKVPGASEVQWNDRWRYPSGEFWTVGLLGWDDDVNYALCWIYGFANGWWNPNGRASEGDQEMYRRVGSALGLHHINQSGPDGYAWVQRGFFGVDFTKPIVAGIKWRENDSVAFFLSNLGSEPQQVGIVTKAQVGDQFIDEAMKGFVSFRPTSYYPGDDAAKAAAKQRRDPMLPGWTGGWNGKSQLMQVFGFKTNAI